MPFAKSHGATACSLSHSPEAGFTLCFVVLELSRCLLDVLTGISQFMVMEEFAHYLQSWRQHTRMGMQEGPMPPRVGCWSSRSRSYAPQLLT